MPPTQKPILLLCGCRKYEEYLHAAIARFDRPEWEIIGIRGGREPTTYNPATRILTLEVDDTYEALPSKLYLAYLWIYINRPGIPGIYKTDDDMVYDVPILAKTVLENIAVPYWGIVTEQCEAEAVSATQIENRFIDKTLQAEHQAAVYCYGWGYWMSAAVLPTIVAAADDFKISAIEDICTGFVLNRAGWEPVCISIPGEEHPRDRYLLSMK